MPSERPSERPWWREWTRRPESLLRPLLLEPFGKWATAHTSSEYHMNIWQNCLLSITAITTYEIGGQRGTYRLTLTSASSSNTCKEKCDCSGKRSKLLAHYLLQISTSRNVSSVEVMWKLKKKRSKHGSTECSGRVDIFAWYICKDQQPSLRGAVARNRTEVHLHEDFKMHFPSCDNCSESI